MRSICYSSVACMRRPLGRSRLSSYLNPHPPYSDLSLAQLQPGKACGSPSIPAPWVFQLPMGPGGPDSSFLFPTRKDPV